MDHSFDPLLQSGPEEQFGSTPVHHNEVRFSPDPEMGNAGQMVPPIPPGHGCTERDRVEDRPAADVGALRKIACLGYIKGPDLVASRAKLGDKVPPDETTRAGD